MPRFFYTRQYCTAFYYLKVSRSSFAFYFTLLK